MVVLRLNDLMPGNVGDVLVRLNLHGMASNRVRVAIGQVGGGPCISQSARDQLVNDLSTSAKTRAQVLRAIAEHPNLAASEFNRAFVLMQYFGHLRRNPNDAPEAGQDYKGYDFWLTKLNQFNGNYVDAEMVKAFLSAIEYRQRF